MTPAQTKADAQAKIAAAQKLLAEAEAETVTTPDTVVGLPPKPEPTTPTQPSVYDTYQSVAKTMKGQK